MSLLYYGTKAWLNPEFDIIAAKKWLNLMAVSDPEVGLMLMRVARNQYPHISKQIDGFIKVFLKSKHGEESDKT